MEINSEVLAISILTAFIVDNVAVRIGIANAVEFISIL